MSFIKDEHIKGIGDFFGALAFVMYIGLLIWVSVGMYGYANKLLDQYNEIQHEKQSRI